VFVLQDDVPAVLVGFLDMAPIGCQLCTDLTALAKGRSADQLNSKQQFIMESAVYYAPR
jgi:hypothetical protein